MPAQNPAGKRAGIFERKKFKKFLAVISTGKPARNMTQKYPHGK